jgi:hypothetical protein
MYFRTFPDHQEGAGKMNVMMTAIRYGAIAFMAVMFTAAFAADSRADEGPWKVSEMAGAVRVMPVGGRAVALKSGDFVSTGDEIETGADSRLVLVRGEATITVAPDSRMSLPEAPSVGLTTTIVQELGTLLLKVNRKPRQHFEVKTPFLAAVVKGTTFTVSVDREGAAVHVVEGLVQVTDIDTRQSTLVRPGQTATTTSQPGGGLNVNDGAGTRPGDRGDAETGADQTETAAAGDSAPGNSENAPGQARKAEDDNSGPGNSENAPGQIKKAEVAPAAVITETLANTTLDMSSLTNGLVSSIAAPGNSGSSNGNSGKSPGSSNSGNGNAGNGNAGSGNSGSGSSVASSVSAVVAQATNGDSGNNGNGNGNGNSGNSGNSGNNGNSNGNSGNAGNSGNSGNLGNSGNSGNSDNSGNSGNSGNNGNGNGNGN